jgi:hypothetical protein
MWIGPSRDIASGEHTLSTRFQAGIHYDSALDGDTRLCGKIDSGANADTGNDEVAFEDAAALQDHLLACDRDGRFVEMEDDTAFFVERLYELSHFPTENAFQGAPFRRHNMNLNPAAP